MMGIKLDAICRALRQMQRDSQNPQNFEEELCVAFKALGLNAQHLGGSNEPDIILYICNHQVAIDAKTTKEGVISEIYVNFDAMERYGTKYEPNNIAVIAPGFSKGNIRDTALKRGVVLIETEAICKLLENHKVYPYTEEQIYKNLFDGNREVIMPEDITPSTVGQETQLQIIRQIFTLKNITTFTLDNLKFHLQAQGIASIEADLQEVLRFLGEPPLNILIERQGEYSFTADLDTIKKRLGLVFTALEFERQPKPPPDKTGKPSNKVTPAEFIHQAGGIFVWREDNKVRIDLNKRSKEVEQTLNNSGLSATSMNNFYFTLRKKAGLLSKIR